MRTRRRWLRAVILALIFGALRLSVVGRHAHPASPELVALFAKYRCEVLDRLSRIHATPNPADEQNRFLILSQAAFPGRYVQCAFTNLDSKMICEAASGFFLDLPRSMYLSRTEIAALHRLGFTGDGSKDNFKLTLDVGSPPDLPRAADLMLTALAVGFETTARESVTFEAPDAQGEGDEAACGVGI